MSSRQLMESRVAESVHVLPGTVLPSCPGREKDVDRLEITPAMEIPAPGRSDPGSLPSSQDRTGFIPQKELFQLSFAQERLWFLHQFDPG